MEFLENFGGDLAVALLGAAAAFFFNRKLEAIRRKSVLVNKAATKRMRYTVEIATALYQLKGQVDILLERIYEHFVESKGSPIQDELMELADPVRQEYERIQLLMQKHRFWIGEAMHKHFLDFGHLLYKYLDTFCNAPTTGNAPKVLKKMNKIERRIEKAVRSFDEYIENPS